ncbi:ComF family protein [Candidatus Saccharibacteria bacterium]|nr:ComF family protein [Candidatus Saccharibacteria bacterium]
MNVKNTILSRIQNTIAPHYCCSCGEIGDIFCEYCKYNINSEPFGRCVLCNTLTVNAESRCRTCSAPYSRMWCVGEYAEELEKLIAAYKFNRSSLAAMAAADLCATRLPQLPSEVVVTGVPTIPAHIRQRGYDHTKVMSQQIAHKTGLTYRPTVERATQTVQRGASRQQRLANAQAAFTCNSIPADTYLLVDDVFTTGATLHYAAQALLDAGAAEVWCVVVARQPLEKQ